MRFLRSVVVDALPEFGTAATLTVRDVPTFAEFKRLIRYLIEYLSRKGVFCWHYVIEWTKAGRPHLHVIIFETEPKIGAVELKRYWLKITRKFGTSERAQEVKELDGPVGFFQYVSKHASRGQAHYQREAELIPDGWQKTGRMWGRSRDGWETDETKVSLARNQFFALRRMVDRAAKASAQADLRKALKYRDKRAEASARASLKHLNLARKAYGHGRIASEVRGINEWVPFHITLALLDLLPLPHQGFDRRETSDTLEFKNDRFRIVIPKPDSMLPDIPI